MSVYSTLKAGWHLDKIASLRKGEPITPVEVQLVLSDFCNHDCHWCAYRSSNGLSVQNFGEVDELGVLNHNPKRMIPKDKAIEILDDAAKMGVKSIIFTGGGEPTVFPDHLEVFAHALDLGLECSLNSNGAILRNGWQDVLPDFTYVRFSVDAGDANQYAKDRRVSSSIYSTVLNNITKVCAEVERSKSDCVVGAGYVVTPDNYIHVYEGIARLKHTGVEYVRMAAMQSTEGFDAYPGNTWERSRAEVKRAKDKFDDDTFTVVDLTDNVMGAKPDYDFCGFQHFVTYIGADLNVYRCCYTAYADLGRINSLKLQTFAQWVKSESTRELLTNFSARSCDNCALNEKNKVIMYLTDPDPKHVNFV